MKTQTEPLYRTNAVIPIDELLFMHANLVQIRKDSEQLGMAAGDPQQWELADLLILETIQVLERHLDPCFARTLR